MTTGCSCGTPGCTNLSYDGGPCIACKIEASFPPLLAQVVKEILGLIMDVDDDIEAEL